MSSAAQRVDRAVINSERLTEAQMFAVERAISAALSLYHNALVERGMLSGAARELAVREALEGLRTVLEG